MRTNLLAYGMLAVIVLLLGVVWTVLAMAWVSFLQSFGWEKALEIAVVIAGVMTYYAAHQESEREIAVAERNQRITEEQ